MLSAKPWKPEAIARLVFCVMLCWMIGSLLALAWYFGRPRDLEGARVFLALGGAAGLLAAGVFRLQRPWQFETVGADMLVLLLCLGPGFGAAVWVSDKVGQPPESAGTLTMVALEPMALVLLARFLKEHGITWAQGFGFGNNWRRAVLFAVLVACVLLPVTKVLQWTSFEAMMRLHLEPKEQMVVQTLRDSSTWLNRLCLGAVAMVLAPPVEEMFFRGIVYPAVKQAGFPRLALWGAAVLFALMHFNVVTFIPLLVLALALTALYEYTDNLLAPILAHALFNTANFILLSLSLG